MPQKTILGLMLFCVFMSDAEKETEQTLNNNRKTDILERAADMQEVPPRGTLTD